MSRGIRHYFFFFFPFLSFIFKERRSKQQTDGLDMFISASGLCAVNFIQHGVKRLARTSAYMWVHSSRGLMRASARGGDEDKIRRSKQFSRRFLTTASSHPARDKLLNIFSLSPHTNKRDIWLSPPPFINGTRFATLRIFRAAPADIPLLSSIDQIS